MKDKKDKEDLDKHIRNKINDFKQVKDILDAHKTRVESIWLRRKWLEAQKRQNYQSEYERIRAHLDTHSILPHTVDRAHLEKRKKQLIDLGVKATSGVSIGL